MEDNSIDDMFSQMLGELDDLTQQLNTVTLSSENHLSTQNKQHESEPALLSNNLGDDFTDFDEEDANLTSILNDLSQIQESINKSQDDITAEDSFSEVEVPEVPLPTTKVEDTMIPPEEEKAPRPVYETPEPVEAVFVKRDISVPPPESIQQAVDKPERSVPPPESIQQAVDKPERSVPQPEIIQQAVDKPERSVSQPEIIRQTVYSEVNSVENVSTQSQEELNEQSKSEKVRIALEKMKEARILKLVVKVLNKDDSSKTLMIDERMSTREVIQQLIEKNHFDFSPHWSLIEEMPSMYIERVFEEHEKPCELMKHWTRDSTNQLRFVERKDKYAMFKNPQHFLLSSSELQDQMQETQKQLLIEEFFSEKGPSSCTPEVEGYLHIKNGKSWSRKYCVLRSSGLYISKTGEPKKGKKLTDLTCLVMFEQNYLYVGRGWKKKFKAPFEFGFALKNPAFQIKSKHIRYLACEDFKSFLRWTVGIRLAKYGRQLLKSYELTNQDMKAHSTMPAMSYQLDATHHVNGSGDPALRSATLPRNVDMKNIFEGAWQRANQPEIYEKPSVECSTIPRMKSSFKTSPKKGSNWWDMRDSGQGSSQSNFDESSLASADDFQSNITAEASVPSSDSDFDLPQDFPPPPSVEDLRLAHGKPLPPSPATKPKFKSSHDRLPHPVGSKPTLPVKPSPPKPSELRSSDPELRMKLPPPPVQPKRTGSNASLRSTGYSETFAPLQPKRTGSNASLRSRGQSEPPPPPPMDLPPPPPVNGGFAPLSNYYISGNTSGNYTKDEFPPPPPFILDLKESFVAVTEPASMERRKSFDQTPRPGKLIAYIKSQTLSRLQGNRLKSKKVPPAPPRTAQTRLSSKRR